MRGSTCSVCTSVGIRAPRRPIPSFHPEHSNGPLDGELVDLYVAILIVVPLALLLKSFFF